MADAILRRFSSETNLASNQGGEKEHSNDDLDPINDQIGTLHKALSSPEALDTAGSFFDTPYGLERSNTNGSNVQRGRGESPEELQQQLLDLIGDITILSKTLVTQSNFSELNHRHDRTAKELSKLSRSTAYATMDYSFYTDYTKATAKLARFKKKLRDFEVTERVNNDCFAEVFTEPQSLTSSRRDSMFRSDFAKSIERRSRSSSIHIFRKPPPTSDELDIDSAIGNSSQINSELISGNDYTVSTDLATVVLPTLQQSAIFPDLPSSPPNSLSQESSPPFVNDAPTTQGSETPQSNSNITIENVSDADIQIQNAVDALRSSKEASNRLDWNIYDKLNERIKTLEKLQSEGISDLRKANQRIDASVQDHNTLRERVMNVEIQCKGLFASLQRVEAHGLKIEQFSKNLESMKFGPMRSALDSIVNKVASLESSRFPDSVVQTVNKLRSELLVKIAELDNNFAEMKHDFDSSKLSATELHASFDQLKVDYRALKRDVEHISSDIRAYQGNNSMFNSPSLIQLGSNATQHSNADLDQDRREKSRLEMSIRSSFDYIKQLAIPLSHDSDVILIKKVCTSDIPKIKKAANSCSLELSKYNKLHSIDIPFYDRCLLKLKAAEDWCLQAESIYSKCNVHVLEHGRALSREVRIFDGTGEQNVYDFLNDFESKFLGWGTREQRAYEMYSKYLSSRIQGQSLDYSRDYDKLRSFLISSYGNPAVILMCLIEGMEKRTKPSRNSFRGWFLFFSDLQNILVKIERLSVIPGIDVKSL